MTLSRLALGTAQLGMDYGIANVAGKPNSQRAEEIVSAALDAGINCFDTAQGYGDSEAVLGSALKSLGVSDGALVVTKLASEIEPGDDISAAVGRSLAAVGTGRLFGLLLHRQEALDLWAASWRPLLEPLRDQGLVDYLGVSVYDNDYMDRALFIEGVDLIQAPFNVFDRRAQRYHWFERAAAAGKVLFVRSVFLQGLLLREPADLPAEMDFARGPLADFRAGCDEAGLTPLEAGLGYVLAAATGAVVIFGAETPEQVTEIAALARRWETAEFPVAAFEGLGQPDDSPVIDPRKWT